MLGAPLVALGFAATWDPVGRLGALIEVVGGLALVVHGAAVQRDRGRWTSDAGLASLRGPQPARGARLAVGRHSRSGPVGSCGWDRCRPPGTSGCSSSPLVAGWIGQVLVGAWTHLVPAIGPGDQARHAVQRRWLGRAATSRWLAWNAGVATVDRRACWAARTSSGWPVARPSEPPCWRPSPCSRRRRGRPRGTADVRLRANAAGLTGRADYPPARSGGGWRSQITNATMNRRISDSPYDVHQTHTAWITKICRYRKYSSKITPASDRP